MLVFQRVGWLVLSFGSEWHPLESLVESVGPDTQRFCGQLGAVTTRCPGSRQSIVANSAKAAFNDHLLWPRRRRSAVFPYCTRY